MSMMFKTVSQNQESACCDSIYTSAKLRYHVRSLESHVVWGGGVMVQAFWGARCVLFHFVNIGRLSVCREICPTHGRG